MRHIFKKNGNLIIKNFISMCLHRKQHIRRKLQCCIAYA